MAEHPQNQSSKGLMEGLNTALTSLRQVGVRGKKAALRAGALGCGKPSERALPVQKQEVKTQSALARKVWPSPPGQSQAHKVL